MAKSKKKNRTNQNKLNERLIKVPKAVETGSPKLVELTCNRCGGTLVLKDEEHAYCPHCGAIYLIDQPEDLNIHIHLKETNKSKAVPKSQPAAAPNSGFAAKVVVGLCLAMILLVIITIVQSPKTGKTPVTSSKEQSVVMELFCQEVLGKTMSKITKEDLERVKYIEAGSIDRVGQDPYYKIRYSLTDYKDCESQDEFAKTIQTWKSGKLEAGQANKGMKYELFTGLTAIKLADATYYTIPEGAPVSCIWATNLERIQKEMDINPTWNPDLLRQLYLTDQEKEDISLLKNFPDLECLTIDGHGSFNQLIPNLNDLSECTKLKILELKFGDAYLGLSALSNMHEMIYLNIEEISLANASFLLEMPKLQYLQIEAEDGDSLSNLQNLTQLKGLVINDGTIRISELPDQPNLTKLGCTIKGQEELNSVSRFTNLEHLVLEEDYMNQLYSVSELGKLENLKELTLGGFFGADYKDMEVVLNLPKIEKLKLYHSASGENHVQINTERLNDESNLRVLTSMKYIFENTNGKADWSFCSALTNVEEMTLFKCKLEDINFLSGLPKLKTIDLEQNKISDYSPLMNCPELTKVYTWGNPTIDANLQDGVEIVAHETIDHWY